MPCGAVTDIAQARFLLGKFANVVRRTVSSKREREVTQGLNAGLNHVLVYKELGLACAFLHRRLHYVAPTEQAVLIKVVLDDLKEIPAGGGKQESPALPERQPYTAGTAEFNPGMPLIWGTIHSVCGRGGGRRISSSKEVAVNPA